MIEVLGAAGSLGQQEGCCAFLIDDTVLIDAGQVIRSLGDQSAQIEHLLLTHSHFDHWVDLPFLIETYFEQRQTPLTVYGLKPTLDALKTHVFNDVIWPRFHHIIHPNLQAPLLKLVEIDFEQTLHINQLTITVIEAQHTVACCGFILQKNDVACVISGDTYLNPALSARINQDPRIQSLLIETSFPSRLDGIAKLSQHLTPELLKQQLHGITRPLNRPLDVFLYHLKPAYQQSIKSEIFTPTFQPGLAINLRKALRTGDVLDVFNPHGVSLQNKPSVQGRDCAQQVDSLLAIAQALSAETHLDTLLEMILEQAIAFAHADAGTLYRISSDSQSLEFSVVQNHSLGLKMGGTADPIQWDNLALYSENGTPNTQMVAALCALNKQAINIKDVYSEAHFDFSGTQKFDAKTGYRSQSMLVIPLLDRDQTLLGVLQLINKQASNQSTVAFTPQDQQNTLALASQAAISLTNALLIQEMEALFEAFIDTIAKAFDEKCSFTGNHVKQVAELAQIIANAIDQDQQVYPNVSYNKAMLKTINIAALLHDVGKITTPEFIMQKSSKLQKIYDRIDLIQHRIEILKRDTHIAHLQAQLAQQKGDKPSDKPSDELDKAAYLRTLTELDEAYAFLQKMNTGNEFLAPAHAQKITDLAQKTYQLGSQTVPLLNADELTNLCIQRGTLNAEERTKIMDHARVSLSMLQTLPFPQKYQRVVDIAANHHEKLDGSGYPRGLTAEQLTLEDRILILADLYEALSAQDRPYKEPHTLADIAKILSSMANAGAIDKTLLAFFFESGAYQAYNRFLKPSQINDFSLTLE